MLRSVIYAVLESPVMSKRYWLIRGHGCDEPFAHKAGLEVFSDRQIREVLRALAAKELSFTEIVGAYPKRGTKNANDLLEVQKGFDDPTYTCGCGVTFFTASIVDEDGKLITYRVL
jgi:hypothetical protein